MRQVVSRGVLGLGLVTAALLPLAGWMSDQPAPPPDDGPDSEAGPSVLMINPSLNVSTRPDGGRGEPPTLPEIKVYNQFSPSYTADLRIKSSPPGKLWHRTAFERAGDQFWALPNARFKLTLAAGSAACTRTTCNASFDTEGLAGGGTLNVAGSQLTSTGSNGQGEIPGCTEFIDLRTPYLVCQLSGVATTETPNANICLWIRRSVEEERPGEHVALDIRWEADPKVCQ